VWQKTLVVPRQAVFKMIELYKNPTNGYAIKTSWSRFNTQFDFEYVNGLDDH